MPSNTPTPTATPQPTPDAQGNYRATLGDKFNADGFSYNTDRTDGNFDGSGNTYPADGATGTYMVNDVTFNMGPYANDSNNIVTATGQVIPLPNQTGDYLYIAAAGTSAQATQTFTINYDGYNEEMALSISGWCGSAAYSEYTTVTFDHRHTTVGDDNGCSAKIYGYRLTLTADAVESITLPNNSAVKVFAMTIQTEAPIATNTPTIAPTAGSVDMIVITTSPTLIPTITVTQQPMVTISSLPSSTLSYTPSYTPLIAEVTPTVTITPTNQVTPLNLSVTPTEKETNLITTTLKPSPTISQDKFVTVTLYFKYRDGKAYSNLKVYIDDNEYNTDSDGKITINQIKLGTHKVFVRHNNIDYRQEFILGIDNLREPISITVNPENNLNIYSIVFVGVMALISTIIILIRKRSHQNIEKIYEQS